MEDGKYIKAEQEAAAAGGVLDMNLWCAPSCSGRDMQPVASVALFCTAALGTAALARMRARQL